MTRTPSSSAWGCKPEQANPNQSPLRRAFFLAVRRDVFLQSILRITAILALAAIWLLTHRYFGIQHDGLFYAVQALARITPDAYAGDIFFAFGSQDDYSLFSRLYAALIRSLGLAARP
jgi:hypothetical protein